MLSDPRTSFYELSEHVCCCNILFRSSIPGLWACIVWKILTAVLFPIIQKTARAMSQCGEDSCLLMIRTSHIAWSQKGQLWVSLLAAVTYCTVCRPAVFDKKRLLLIRGGTPESKNEHVFDSFIHMCRSRDNVYLILFFQFIIAQFKRKKDVMHKVEERPGLVFSSKNTRQSLISAR